MEAFECTGLWWLPEQEDARVAGTLKCSSSGNLQLSLVGSLARSANPFAPASHPIIFGSVEKSPLGNAITLAGSIRVGVSMGSFADAREKYRASRGFFGEHLSGDSDFLFKNASIQITSLTEWADVLTGFSRDADGAASELSLGTYSQPTPLFSPVPGGSAILGVTFTRSYSNSPRVHSFREETQFRVQCEKLKSVDEINSAYVYPLQNLMTFVCDRAQDVTQFSVEADLGTETLRPASDIHVIGPRVQPDADDEPKARMGSHEMLFTLKDVDFTQIIDRWVRLSDRYSDAFSIYFGLQYGPPAYIDVAFLTITQAIQIFYARTDGGIRSVAEEETRLKSLVSRLPPTDADWIIDHLGTRPMPALGIVLRSLMSEHAHGFNALISERQDRFANDVMNTVHYVAHRDPEVSLAASHGADLYWMMQKLRFLVKACFLSELGFSEEKIGGLFERNPLYRHIRDLEAARESGSPSKT